MADKKTKLELTWIGKENRPKLEPRILLEQREHSFGVAEPDPHGHRSTNMLIHGDNLLALKALEHGFAGQVKCVCVDPPYNTGSAFEHYDDGVEHSLWLTLMRDRLHLFHRLLRPDGSIWIIIDDNEAHYLKVLCDEVFGRANFFGSITWQHSVQGKNDAKQLSLHHNYILIYRKSDAFQRKLLPRTADHNVNYANPDGDPRGPWRSGDVRSPNLRENLRYTVTTPSGKRIPPPEKGWRWSKETFDAKVATGEITFREGDTRVLRKIYLSDQDGRVPESIWLGQDVGTTREASGELSAVLPDAPTFATPKPERLISQILAIATNEGDWVLDSFLGSGTTAAVAHKMRRRWIGVELGDHALTHCLPRLRAVVDGVDAGGVSAAASWKGGGGFRFYRLAPSLLERDKWGNYVISESYRKGPDAGARLAEAMCKLEGFTYAPSPEHFWVHGTSTERDFIYVTTQNLGADQVRSISEDLAALGEHHSLLICCGAFRCSEREFANITLKKIPSAVLTRCEWGKDDYSLNVASVTGEEPDDASDAPAPTGERAAALANGRRGRPKKPQPAQLLPLFTPKEGA